MTDTIKNYSVNNETFGLNDNELLICSLFTEDDRSTVPTLTLVEAENISKVRGLAERTLHASPHHLQVEVRCDDELLFVVRRDEPA